MPSPSSQNRQMFWRIVRRLLGANRGRMFVILLALGAGAAVTAALLNLQVDAKRRITTEFSAFGPNVVVVPKNASSANSETLPETIVHSVPADTASGRVGVISVLYVIASVSGPQASKSHPAVVEGVNPLFFLRASASPALTRDDGSSMISPPAEHECVAGANVVRNLNVQQDAQLSFAFEERRENCQIASVRSVGGPEDDHIEIGLRSVQRLANLSGRISALRLTVPGAPSEIQSYIAELQHLLPDADVRPVRQFTDAQAKIYDRISGLLSFTVGVVLVLTGLCVMAAMTNVAMERKNDVGLMKAIGGATRRVLRLFIAEAALLGLAGGVIGGAVGIFLSIWLGKQVFGVAAQPRLIVYPVSVALTVLVAILSAYPLRRLASLRPASVFRGEA